LEATKKEELEKDKECGVGKIAAVFGKKSRCQKID